MLKKWFGIAFFAGLAAIGSPASAQSTIGYGATVVIPIVAQTGSYSTEVFVHNPTATLPLTVRVDLIGGIGSSSPGITNCAQLVVPAGGSASFKLDAQCSLATAPPNNKHFGMLVVADDSAESLTPFFAYSRTQNPQAIGFSVEGFPAGNLSAQSQRVNGLARTLPPAAIPLQTNCFVASGGKPVDYFIRLKDATGNSIGTGVTGHLNSLQLIRYLDIFAAANLPTGDFSNISATISSVNPNGPGNRDHPLFVSYCTVQDNASFGADFRIGKSFTAWDDTHQQQAGGCTPADCGVYDYAIPDPSKKHVFALFVRTPDNIRCDLLSDRLPELEMQLREPETHGDCDLCGFPPGSAAFPATPGPVVAGGNNLTGFYYSTEPDIIRPSDGTGLRNWWTLEVSARELIPAVVGPIPYSLSCKSGNGTTYRAPVTAADDF